MMIGAGLRFIRLLVTVLCLSTVLSEARDLDVIFVALLFFSAVTLHFFEGVSYVRRLVLAAVIIYKLASDSGRHPALISTLAILACY